MKLKNALNVTGFRFYKDVDLKMPLSQDNLYDQVDTDGWIDLYFGGHSIFIPQIGQFETYIICDTTFFWDILDENNKRTKDGIETMFISKNKNMVPWYGDLIPNTPNEVFDYFNEDSAIQTEDNLICANLFFYNNLFKDEYYRYNLILLPKDKTWPDEENALILPMNDKIKIPKDYYIVGYRPKPEYLYELAITPLIKSGKENAIHFRIKIDMNYFSKNLNIYRSIRIFSMSNDNPRYMLYPKIPTDLNWDMYNKMYMPEFKKYLLEWSINQNLPNDSLLKQIYSKRKFLLKYNNILSKLDSFNIKDVAKSIIEYNKQHKPLHGVAQYIYKSYSIWEKEQFKDKHPTRDLDILNYIMLKQRPWNGFQRLYNEIYKVNKKFVYENTIEEEFKKHYIVTINGVKQFNGEYIPDASSGYLSPPKGYYYAGDIGNGMYLVNINNTPTPVYCDMENGGWMLLLDGGNRGYEYSSRFFNNIEENAFVDEKYGFEFSKGNNIVSSNIKYSQIKVTLVDFANKCGNIKTHIYGNRDLFVYIESGYNGECKSSLTLKSDVEYSDNTQIISNQYIIEGNENDSITIKYELGKDFSNVKKYIKFLWVKM